MRKLRIVQNPGQMGFSPEDDVDQVEESATGPDYVMATSRPEVRSFDQDDMSVWEATAERFVEGNTNVVSLNDARRAKAERAVRRRLDPQYGQPVTPWREQHPFDRPECPTPAAPGLWFFMPTEDGNVFRLSETPAAVYVCRCGFGVRGVGDDAIQRVVSDRQRHATECGLVGQDTGRQTP